MTFDLFKANFVDIKNVLRSCACWFAHRFHVLVWIYIAIGNSYQPLVYNVHAISSHKVNIRTINPATEQVLSEYEAISEQQVHQEVNHSRMVFDKIWKKIDISERSKLLRHLASMLLQRKMEYATIITNEMGKPISESLKEVEKCSWVCNYYADHGKKFLER